MDRFRHRRSFRLVALAVTVALPLVGTSAVASAKVKAGCHRTHTCKGGSGAPTGSGTGGTPAPITVQVDPNPLVETFQSDIIAIVQVETSPSFAGDAVDISSSQLSSSCFQSEFLSFQGGAGASISVALDDEGNATLYLLGFDCAPGSDLFEADLAAAPYYTATQTLTVSPPAGDRRLRSGADPVRRLRRLLRRDRPGVRRTAGRDQLSTATRPMRGWVAICSV
jgi:hypothetical protein